MNAPRAAIVRGVVRHRRLRPAVHAFEYPSCMLLLPMRSLRDRPAPGLARNRFGWLAFHDRDHGEGGNDALAWVERLLADEGLAHEIDGEIWLQTQPRALGYAFKPVSFWYCHRADGSLAAVVVEVNNTFGERHCYLLHGAAYGRELLASKVFHVSPFNRVQGGYRFRFMRTDDRVLARIDHEDAEGPLLQTSVSGRLLPLTAASARAAFLAMPWMSLAVIARIHWQALKLWRKRVPFFAKPKAPQVFTTRSARP